RGIRGAKAAGLGSVGEQDIGAEPTVTLLQAMQLAAERDQIARQYTNGFAEVFEEGAPALLAGIGRTRSGEGGIIDAHLHLLAKYPDSLIVRKRGLTEAQEASRRAARVLEAGWPGAEKGRKAIRELDDWLREIGHQRNPGTTADLVAASLFVLLRSRKLWPK